MLALALKVPKMHRKWLKMHFWWPHCRLRRSCHWTPTNIRLNLIKYGLEVEFVGYISRIFVVSSEKRMISIAECAMTVQGHPRSMIFVSSKMAYTYIHIRLIEVTYATKQKIIHWQGEWDSILVTNSNLNAISHHFWDTATYLLKTPVFPTHLCSTPNLRMFPLH